MRTKLMLSVLLFAIGIALGLGWRNGQTTTRRLETEREALRRERSELARVQDEHRRLRAALDEASRRASLRDREAAVAPPAIVAPPPPPPTKLVPGEWAASAAWGNRGQATAPAAVETALWAAAGGDVSTLIGLLELEPATRSRAAELLSQLPAATRQAFGSPEKLVAVATMEAIPVTEAQVAWFNEVDADHAVVGLMLGATDAESTAVQDLAARVPNPPPSLADQGATKLTYLTLRRVASGWRLVVPASAIDRIARELGVPGG